MCIYIYIYIHLYTYSCGYINVQLSTPSEELYAHAVLGLPREMTVLSVSRAEILRRIVLEEAERGMRSCLMSTVVMFKQEHGIIN
jgi:hypothetical protein